MGKKLGVTIGIMFFVLGAQAQVQTELPKPVKNNKLEIIPQYKPLSLFNIEDDIDDPEQEAEIEEAARIEMNGTVTVKREATPQAKTLGLSNFYNSKTLLIPISRSEIQKKNTWRQHGVAFDKFMNVTAYANKRNGDFQCTEVTHRFLNQIFGVPTKVGNGMGHANVLAQNFVKAFGDETYKYKGQNVKMVLRRNGVSTEPPAVGSAINFQSGRFGHIAIVRFVEVIDKDTVRIHLFEQHGFPKHAVGAKKEIRSIDFDRSASGKWTGERVLGIGQVLYWINFTVI